MEPASALGKGGDVKATVTVWIKLYRLPGSEQVSRGNNLTQSTGCPYVRVKPRFIGGSYYHCHKL
jgi:hypothetical protein